MNEKNEPFVETSIKTVAGVGSGLIGALVGLAVAGPGGAMVGGALGGGLPPLAEYAAFVARRGLGMREERRIGSVLEEAIARIKANIDAGNQLREDDFLDAGFDDRAAADEMCEAAIRAAQVEFEERKIPFQGYLIASILFHSEVDREQANLLMRLASELSYRQLCLLSLFNRAEEFDYFFRPSLSIPSQHDYDGGYSNPDFRRAMEHFSSVSKAEEEAAAAKLTGTHYAIRQEIYDLYACTLLRNENESGEGKLVLPHHFHYDEIRVTNMGRVVYSLMSLVEMDIDDLNILAALMRQHPRYR